jgi:hypothetical protein
MPPPITAVLLNWKRPGNVARILDSLQRSGMVAEAIVWNNAPAQIRHGWATVVNASRDVGLYSRFVAACLARTECILVQDDDLELPSETLRALREAWEREPGILHGIFGRKPPPDGTYSWRCGAHGEVPVVLTRALLTHRRHIASFFQVAPRFTDIQENSIPYGNGEDIIFSYAALRGSGKMNRAHDLPVIELPAPHAISTHPGHDAHRTLITRRAQEWLASEAT